MRSLNIAIFVVCLLALAATENSYSSGGGGGPASSSVPSVEVPKYDAASEFRIGVEALEGKRFAAAEKAFKHVLSITPRDAKTHYLLGMAKNGQKDIKAGRKSFEKALKYDGSLIAAQQELAIADIQLKEPNKARPILDSLKKRSKACADSCREAADLRAAIAAIELALGSKQGAIENASRSLVFSDQSQGDRAYLQAVSLINQKRYEEAIISLKNAQQAFGPHPDILTYLGFSYRKLGIYDRAEDYYRQALAVAPDHRGATEYFGELMVERGDIEGARKMLNKLTKNCSFGCAEADELGRWIASVPSRPD